MGEFSVLAQAFHYPAPGGAEQLALSLAQLPPGRAHKAFASFLEEITTLSLGGWEELYTRTWDLNPVVPPYVGFQVWGEDYRRGKFMSALQRAYSEAGVEPQAELPDHLLPVLLYLDQTTQPIPDLTEVLEPAVERMAAVMGKRDPHNPYRHLLEAVLDSLRRNKNGLE